jgi:pimeloyl-ACP methyl ester carboxylesterase
MKLHFHETGSGPPVVLLHGMLGSHHNLLPVAAGLSHRFKVLALDQRNHGASPHFDALDYEVLAADLARFIQTHRLPPVHLLGHSMGGKAAMRFAQLFPDQLRKLIVVDMSPRAQPARYDYLLDALRDLDPARYEQRQDVDAALAAAIPDQSIRQFLLKNLGRDSAGRLAWKPNIAALHANYHHLRAGLPTAPSFSGPTLFIRGERSDYLRGEDWPMIRNIFPKARLETIPHAGHWVHAEAFEPFMQVIREFLESPGES